METQDKVGRELQAELWPALPFNEWKETLGTLHMWTQVVGKVRLELSPYANHWWQVPFYVTARGLTTSPIPYEDGMFEVNFDFIDHNLLILTSGGSTKALPLFSRSVADFYQEFMAVLHSLGIDVRINTLPSEVQNPIRCDEDLAHCMYDAAYVSRFRRILVQADLALREHRSFFIGKSSPIHFFWGSFDLALTFFSGRRAPAREGADSITREAYSHEVISFGFWPGNEQYPRPAFYSYTQPAPQGMAAAPLLPPSAFYSPEIGEFLLPYDDVRGLEAPRQALLDFFHSAYEAGANLAGWDRATLERSGPQQ